MIETNAFIFAFAVLVLTVSVMHMVVLMRFVRVKTASMPDEYFAQLNAGEDREQSVRQFVRGYRFAHSMVALLGVLLLVWLAGYLQRPDWDRRWVVFPVVVYFVLQWLPMLFTAMTGLRHMKVLKSFLFTTKRKAALKRRGLFDFVSPWAIATAVVAYLLLVAFALYSSGYSRVAAFFVGAVTLDYGLTAFSLHRLLYGRKSDPFETHAGRLFTIGVRARSAVYSSIAVVLFMAFTLAVISLHLDRWIPAGLAVFLIIATVITFRVFTSPSRPSNGAEFDPTQAAS
jgi:hypothetical protein